MAKLSINLLPPEIAKLRHQDKKRLLVNQISIGFLGLMILITIAVIGARLYENTAFRKQESQNEDVKGVISTYKKEETLAVSLKNRVDKITSLNSQSSVQSKAFLLITSLLPEGVTLSALTADSQNKVIFEGTTTNLKSFQDFFGRVNNPKDNQGYISTVKVDSITVNQEGEIRFSISFNFINNNKAVVTNNPSASNSPKPSSASSSATVGSP